MVINNRKTGKVVVMFLGVLALLTLGGCQRQSDKVSYNVSKEADNFNVVRRVAIINTRTDKIEFEVIGNLSVNTEDKNKLVVIAEVSKDNYKKHLINLTGNNMYVVEDLEGADVNSFKYEVNYLPESIIPFTVKQSK